MVAIIGKPINGISINKSEYATDDNGEFLIFKLDYLRIVLPYGIWN